MAIMLQLFKIFKTIKGRLGFKNNQEYKQKRANIMKGRVFWNNGLISIRSIDCPGPSFVRGRLKKVNIN